MHFPTRSPILLGALAMLGGLVEGKTDLAGCTKYTTTVGNAASIVYFVPDTLEICTLLDCGGGRAPPKSKPGCPLYQGTETVTPSFLESNPLKTSTSALAPSSVPSTRATTTSSGTAATAGSGSGTAVGPGSSTTAGPGVGTAAGSGADATAVSGTGATEGSGSAVITSPPASKTGASSSPSAPAGSAAAPAAAMKGLPALVGLAAAVLLL
ncbi:hypothetical protein MAPG_04531 [Magnaporthiopsis poae ATCC 64411]|uniref:Siderophore biosynthesis enzyme n=1 Tax=Magnaporthiopsis poae (strain ATCC 64411 / 73-15) TaxID=644358 RepID=A0A0C4DWZ6_MAGP6|nr:hypothetical protein MAPG_04531 [Magnaporthiopsis poae ATCC 64411]